MTIATIKIGAVTNNEVVISNRKYSIAISGVIVLFGFGRSGSFF